MRTQYCTASSLDGFIATPDDSLERLFPLGDINETAEIIVQVGSVTLGAGKPLLPRRITTPLLVLVAARRIGPGFAELRCEVPARTAAA